MVHYFKLFHKPSGFTFWILNSQQNIIQYFLLFDATIPHSVKI